jgi:hypothetical protein
MLILVPLRTSIGNVVSTTRTILVTVLEIFPAQSMYVYTNVYTPTTPVCTDPETTTIPVLVGASDQIAQLSVYHEPCAIVISLDHTKATIGEIVSITRTILVIVLETFPAQSV